MRFLPYQSLCKKVTVKDHEKVLEAAKINKGIIIVTGHFGNWEYAPIAGALQFPEYQGRFHIIRKTLGVKYLEKLLFRQSYQAGINVIPNRNALTQVMCALEKNDLVVFVMDQRASVKKRKGILIDFFGQQAGTYKSLALIARASRAPILPAVTYRCADGSHVLQYFDPVEWIEDIDEKKAVQINTRRYNEVIEKFIIDYPEQWLWLHNRFKLS